MELISVHIPKTAGVTFRNVLRHVYGAAAVNFDYGDRALDPEATCRVDPAAWAAETQQRVRTLPPAVRVVHGHFSSSKYDAVFPAAQKVIWLREPVARLISHYHYWRELPVTPHPLHRRLLGENLSLLEFARLEPMRNILSRVFLPDTGLNDFAFVGLQEHFESDLTQLARLLHWARPLVYEEANRNLQAAYRREPLRDAIWAEIAELNAEDSAIYSEALASRARRLVKR